MNIKIGPGTWKGLAQVRVRRDRDKGPQKGICARSISLIHLYRIVTNWKFSLTDGLLEIPCFFSLQLKNLFNYWICIALIKTICVVLCLILVLLTNYIEKCLEAGLCSLCCLCYSTLTFVNTCVEKSHTKLEYKAKKKRTCTFDVILGA